MRALTVRQPWADLILHGGKDVENRTWPVPSTLPEWYRCVDCDLRERSSHDHLELSGHYHRDESGIGGGFRDMEPDGLFPFTIAVHAGLTWDRSDAGERALFEWSKQRSREDRTLIKTGDLRKRALRRMGAFLGTVDVTECHHGEDCQDACRHGWSSVDGRCAYCGAEKDGACSKWADPFPTHDVYHWTLASPRPLPEPIPARGRPGLWIVSDEQADAIAVGLAVTA